MEFRRISEVFAFLMWSQYFFLTFQSDQTGLDKEDATLVRDAAAELEIEKKNDRNNNTNMNDTTTIDGSGPDSISIITTNNNNNNNNSPNNNSGGEENTNSENV